MKKPLQKAALFFMCAMSSMSLGAKDYVFETFDAMPQTWTGVTTTANIVNNTVKSALNPSNVVLSAVRLTTDASTTGVQSAKRSDAGVAAITGNQYAHVMMYRNNTGLPQLKVNDDVTTGGGIISPVAGTATVANEWQDVVFDISGATAGVDYVYIILDNASALTDTAKVMIDNIVFNNDATPRTKTIATAAKIESYCYPSKGANNEYSLENNWIYSTIENNFVPTLVGGSNYVRGMAMDSDYLYFPDRSTKSINRMSRLTGEFVDTIELADTLFTTIGKAADGITDSLVTAGVLPMNDIKFDGAGHMLLGNGAGMPFQVWMVNTADGSGVRIVDENLNVNYPDASIRFDAFGVYGDVTSNAVILAANANSFEVYKWVITNGVAGDGELIELDYPWSPLPETQMTNPGSAPQVFPVDDTYFYLDGNATFPTLYDNEGNLMDGFYNNQALLNEVRISGTDTVKWSMNEGHNGLEEFQIGNEYFLVMAGRNTVATNGIASYFTIYKFADAMKSFADMTYMWHFPEDGMGVASNAYRTAMPTVLVEDYMAHISVYTGQNGVATYTMKNMAIANDNSPIVGVQNPSVEGSIQMYVNDNLVTLSEVANVEVYNLMGQKVASEVNTNTISINDFGMYIIKATNAQGVSTVSKVIIK